MAKSYVTYQGNGTTTTYAVTFPYLARLHVHVLIGGAETDSWTWLTPSSIKLDSPTTDVITIIRTTPTEPLVDFTDGSVLTENQLDIATIQALYVCEETQDAAKYALSNIPDGPDAEVPGDGLNWNAKNLKIINLKNGTLPMDAINKQQLDALIPDIEEEVRRAEEAAKAAEASAVVAENAKNSALASANKAETEAIKAKNSADSAKVSETNASVSAAEANASAVESAGYAKESKNYSESAKASSDSAKDSETRANQYANDAKASADRAGDHASVAQKAKQDAQASASAAQVAEGNAAFSANKAEQFANKAAMHEYNAQVIVDNFNPALMFKGSIDITLPAPSMPENGDTYLVEATAVAHSSWSGLSGTEVAMDSLVVFGDDNAWHNTGSVADQPANGITQEDINNWNQAYSWNDHSKQGYITTENDPVFRASPASSITEIDITNWNNPPSGLPDQTGQKDNYLRTTGSVAYWSPVMGGGGGGLASLVANDCIYLNRQEIVDDYSMPSGFNGMTAGPIKQTGDVYIPEGSEWSIVGGGGTGSSNELQQKVDYLEDKVYKMETLLRQIGKQTEKG